MKRDAINSHSVDQTPKLAMLANARAPVVFTTRVGKRTAAERTYWPRLGGIRDGELVGRQEFGEDWFVDHYEPADEATGYVAGNVMLRNRAQEYHLPLAKAGWTTLPDLRSRQDDLNADRYGGWRRLDGVLVEDAGCHWEMQRTMLTYEPHPMSCVQCIDRGVRVRLPRGYGFRAFEKDMHRRMLRSSLNTFVKSESGKAHFGKLGIDPRSVPHFTKYGFGSGSRVDAASELYVMRPRQDVSRIAMIAEDLVLHFVRELASARRSTIYRGNILTLHP